LKKNFYEQDLALIFCIFKNFFGNDNGILLYPKVRPNSYWEERNGIVCGMAIVPLSHYYFNSPNKKLLLFYLKINGLKDLFLNLNEK